jgi:hypothetical protein
VPRAQVTLGEFPGTGDCTVISQGNCCRPSRCTSRALAATPVETWPKFRVIWTLQEALYDKTLSRSSGAGLLFNQTIRRMSHAVMRGSSDAVISVLRRL